MMLTFLAPALGVLAMLSQDPQPAPEAQEPQTIAVAYADGRGANVQVLALEGDIATLRLLVLGGSMDVRRNLSDFTPASSFRIASAAIQPDSFEEHFGLAKRAADLRLLRQAGDQARAAIEVVAQGPDAEKQTQVVRGWAADTLEGWFGEAVQAGQRRDAEHYLRLLSTRLADQRSEEQLDALAQKLEGLELAEVARRQAASQARLDARQRAEIERRLQPIRADIARGDRSLRQAVSSSRRMTQSANHASSAIDAYRAAWRALEQLQRQHPDDAPFAAEAEALALHMQERGIQAGLHAANMLTVRSDYQGAMEWVNRVLEFDAGNAEAREMRNTILVAGAAASNMWGWGWGAWVPAQ